MRKSKPRPSPSTFSTLVSRPVRDLVDVRPVPFTALRRRAVIGLLTLEATPASTDSPISTRCRCGVRTLLRAGRIAEGLARSCGNLSLHGLH